MALDKLVAHEGSHSLSVVFDGSSNPDFSLYEIVPVEPGREYRFGAYMKTSEVTTDNGVRFVVSGKGTAPGEQVEALSDNVVGTTDWKLYQISFHTGPTTQLISVSLRRFRSTKFNNMIQGKVWVDKASLKTAS